MIFLDTSSAIQILNGNNSLESLIEKFEDDSFGITTPSIFELYHGIYKLKSLKKKISEQKYNELYIDLENFVNQFTIFSLNGEAANYAARIHIELKAKGQEIEVFDCLIAAIILTNNFKKIITLNQKHFQKIEKLEVYSF